MATLFGLYPFLLKLYADGGYQGPQFQGGLRRIMRHVDVEIVKRSDATKGFTVLPRRWIVERTIAWLNSAFSGSYRETLDNPAFDLDIAQTRRGRIKYGYVINLEQALSDEVGLFGRWSWNDGKTEIMAFTDIDASLSLGLSLKGAKWGRPDDVIGIGGAINALSRDHRDFIAAGGLGILIGDGQLNYRRERILETYYAYALNKQLTLTADYQLVTNPAYNADRGPVHIFSGRLHGEF